MPFKLKRFVIATALLLSPIVNANTISLYCQGVVTQNGNDAGRDHLLIHINKKTHNIIVNWSDVDVINEQYHASGSSYSVIKRAAGFVNRSIYLDRYSLNFVFSIRLNDINVFWVTQGTCSEMKQKI